MPEAAAEAARLLYERGILRGTVIDDPGRLQHSQVDDLFAQSEDRFGDAVRKHGLRGDRLRQAVLLREVANIGDPLDDAMRRAGLGLDDLFDAFPTREELVHAMPSRWVISELQLARHAQGARFERGDLRDLGAIAVAIAYCDIVVTEKQWVHIAQQAELNKRFGTIITRDAAEIAEILDASAVCLDTPALRARP